MDKEMKIEERTKKVKRVWYNDGTTEIFDGTASSSSGVDAFRSGRHTFIPWTSIRKIEEEEEYY